MYILLWALGPLGPITLLVQHTYTCTAHLCLLYKALMYIFSLRNTIQSSSISNTFLFRLLQNIPFVLVRACNKR